MIYTKEEIYYVLYVNEYTYNMYSFFYLLLSILSAS